MTDMHLKKMILMIINADSTKTTIIGHQGDNYVNKVAFNVRQTTQRYGDGTFYLIHKRSADLQGYPCEVVKNGDTVIWDIRQSDVAFQGKGQAQLYMKINDAVVYSEIYATQTLPSISSSEEPPAPWQPWVDQVIEAKEYCERAVVNNPYIGEEYTWQVWQEDEWHDTGVDARGLPGEPGEKGEDGTAATITVGTVETVSSDSPAVIENVGDETAAIFNFQIPRGLQGAKGDPGEPGEPGKSTIIPKGQWNSSVSYDKLDTVINSGSSYIAVNNVPSGIDINNSEYWQLVAQRGTDGEKGDAASIRVGTVETVPYESSASVENVGTQYDAVFNFKIPKGSDAAVTKENIESALGYTPVSNANYRNIENASLSGSTLVISRSEDPFRVPYDFQSVVLMFDANNVSSSYAPKMQVYVNDVLVADNMQPLGTQSNSKGFIYIGFKGNMIQVYSANQAFYNSSYYDTNTVGITNKQNLFFDNPRINKIKLQISSSAPLATGNLMSIYGQK